MLIIKIQRKLHMVQELIFKIENWNGASKLIEYINIIFWIVKQIIEKRLKTNDSDDTIFVNPQNRRSWNSQLLS